MSLPKLVVFDLDDTLWYPEMWLISGPPFRKDPHTGAVYDRSNQQVQLFPGAKRVLSEIVQKYRGIIKVGYASRTDYPKWAFQCLQLIEVDGVSLHELAEYMEIYPGDKKQHFRNIQRVSKIPFEHMIFYDNENRNTISVAQLGVCCYYTPDGMTYKHWQKSLTAFANTYADEED
jgi:magnesium-dependent phosphatase 1